MVLLCRIISPTALEGSFGLVWAETAQKPARVLTETTYVLTIHIRLLFIWFGFELSCRSLERVGVSSFHIREELCIAVASTHDLEAALENLTEKSMQTCQKMPGELKDLREGYYPRSA